MRVRVRVRVDVRVRVRARVRARVRVRVKVNLVVLRRDTHVDSRLGPGQRALQRAYHVDGRVAHLVGVRV